MLDEATNHLTLLSGTRRDGDAAEGLAVLKRWLVTKDIGEANTTDIEKAMVAQGVGRQAIRDALRRVVEGDELHVRTGRATPSYTGSASSTQ